MQYRVTLAFLALGTLTLSAQAACKENVAGPTVNWAVFVCGLRHETDDFAHPGVQACLKTLIKRDAVPSAPAEICRLNTKYKTELCRFRAEAVKDMPAATCIRSVETVPKEVSQGIGG
jgi:hypothetical protein